MSIRKHSEAQMIEALNQVEAGRTAADVGRELGLKSKTEYMVGGVRPSTAGFKGAEPWSTRLKSFLLRCA
jgi:hypothetical protein